VIASKESKTRIIRLANLNPASFDHYIAFGVGCGLIESNGSRYQRTATGAATLEAIGRLFDRTQELNAAVREFGTSLGGRDVAPIPDLPTLRFVSSIAWDELTRRATRQAGFERSPNGGAESRSGGRRTGDPEPLVVPGIRLMPLQELPERVARGSGSRRG
jgi:Winged helix-turn-helix